MKPRSKKLDKKLDDNERLLRAWRAWHREQLKEALARIHADVMQRLLAELKDLRSARELVAFIEAQDWTAVDANTRLIALHEINIAITKLRVRAEQDPIDDALPDQPLRAFQLIRNIINPSNNRFPATCGERRAEAIGKIEIKERQL
jgi:hypothetical protein